MSRREERRAYRQAKRQIKLEKQRAKVQKKQARASVIAARGSAKVARADARATRARLAPGAGAKAVRRVASALIVAVGGYLLWSSGVLKVAGTLVKSVIPKSKDNTEAELPKIRVV